MSLFPFAPEYSSSSKITYSCESHKFSPFEYHKKLIHFYWCVFKLKAGLTGFHDMAKHSFYIFRIPH